MVHRPRHVGRNRRTSARRRIRVEPLEARRMLDSTVVFNEIMYNPAGAEENLEWIELYNQMAVDMDLSGWSLDGAVDFTFPQGTVVAGGDYLVVAADPAALEVASGYGTALGPFDGRLSNGGERIELRSNTDRLMNEVDYDDRDPWPVAADGSGASLAKLRQDGASHDPANWAMSTYVGGTPGVLNFAADGDDADRRIGLVGAGSSAKILVPTAGPMPADWTAVGFDDSAWTDGATGIGFDADNVATEPIDAAGNLALGKPIVDGSGSFDTAVGDFTGGDYAPALAVDGVLHDAWPGGAASYWLGRDGVAGDYFTVDLGAVYNIDQFVLQNTHNRWSNDRGTDAFSIRVSTLGPTGPFVDVLTGNLDKVYGADGTSAPLQAFSVDPTPGRWVRFQADSFVDSPIAAHGTGLSELMVFGEPLNANNVALFKQVVATTGQLSEDFAAQNVTDGSDADVSGETYWLGREGVSNESFTVDLGDRYAIDEFRLRNTHNEQFDDRGTADFEIHVANRIDAAGQLVDPVTILSGALTDVSSVDFQDPIPADVFTSANGLTPATARYVRFQALSANNPEGNVGLNEIEIFGSLVRNRAKGSTVVAGTAHSGNFLPYHAVDGTLSDLHGQIWLGRDTVLADESFTVDLGEPVWIEEIDLFNTDNATFGDRGTGDFEVWGANAVDGAGELIGGELILSGTLATVTGGAIIVPEVFTAADGLNETIAQYVKFVAKTSDSTDGGTAGVGLTEIEIYGGPVENVALGKPVVSVSGYYSGQFLAQNVTDGSNTDVFGVNYWLGRDGVANEWFTLDLGAPIDIAQIHLLNTHNAQHNDRGVIDFEIAASNVLAPGNTVLGNNVILSSTLTDTAGQTVITPDIFHSGNGLTPTTARYLRFTSITAKNNNAGLNEIRVYGTPATHAFDPAQIDEFNGADPGEGLDLEGNFAYAINVGGAGGSSLPVGDATFQADTDVAAVTVSAQNHIGAWNLPPVLGDSAADNNLETVLHSIRWSGENYVGATMPVIAGNQYKLQLLFAENIAGNRRVFNVDVEGHEVAANVVALDVHGNFDPAVGPDGGAVVTYEFTALDDVLDVQLSPGTGAPDRNPTLAGFTLEDVTPSPAPSDPSPPPYLELAPQPAGYWTFDNTADDASGNGLDATLAGPTYIADAPAIIGAGSSLAFDGVDDIATVVDFVQPAAYTLSAWVKLDALPAASTSIVLRTSSSGQNTHWSSQLRVRSDGLAEHYSYADGGFTVVGSTPLTPGQWYHLAATGENNGEMRLFVNGLEDAAPLACGVHWADGDRWVFGTDFAGVGTSSYLDGRIDDAALFDAVLSHESIYFLALGASPMAINGYAGLFETDLLDTMKDVNATALVRAPFIANGPDAYESLTLDMRYDDGFIAYLNGTQIAAVNEPVSPDWNSTSTAEHDDRLAARFESFDLTPHLGLLLDGPNVLAIHGLNLTAGDDDFLIDPQLTAVRTDAGPYLSSLVLNEVAGAADATFQIEVVNTGDDALELAGVVVMNATTGQQHALASQTLAAGGFAVVDESQLGFDAVAGDRLFLFSPGTSATLDAVVVEDHPSARSPDGSGRWQMPDVATFPGPNSFALHDEIVINEIMYRHRPQHEQPGVPYADVGREWIELFNRSDHAVDLGGWQLADAIDFTFPLGTTLDAGEYLVVADNATSLLLDFPGITIAGEFDRNLSNDTDNIVLLDAAGNVADEVRYFDGGRWPDYADGGGSSLELRDPTADNNRPEAWAASDETARSQWQTYSYRATVDPIVFDPPINFNEFVMGLLSAGEILIDDLSVIEDPDGAAIERIQNGSFEADVDGGVADKWRLVGTHNQSHVVATTDALGQPTNALRLIAVARENYLSNHAETTLVANAPVVNGQTYDISFEAKWLAGTPQLHTELYYKDAAAVTILQTPVQSGTPGAPNSTLVANAGPTYDGLTHAPAIPGSTDPVVVSVAADDADGIATMTLKYAVSGVGPFTALPMTAQPGGTYQASIPAMPNGTIVQFYVEGADGAGGISTYPAAGEDSRALYKVVDGFAADPLRHDFLIVMTPDETDMLHTDTRMMDNNRWGSTVVYNGHEVFYDVGTRLKGSMFSRNNIVTTGYNVRFHADQPFRGVHETVSLDQNGEREVLVKHLTHEAGNLGGVYDDVFQLITPSGAGGGPTLTSMARHDDIFLEEQFDNGADGTLFKFEGIRVMLNNTGAENLKTYQPIGWVPQFDILDLGDDKELYRWPYLIHNNRDEDDYSRIIDMAKAFSLTGAELESAVAEVLDVDQWMSTFAMMSLAGIGDVYSQGNPHNVNFYVRPEDNKVLAFPWDWDFTFSQPATAALHGNKNIAKVIDRPVYERLFHGHLLNMIETVFNVEYMSQWTAHYGTMLGENHNAYLTNIQQRGDYVLSQLPAQIPFEITTPDGTVVADTAATIAGRGWIDVAQLRLLGGETLDATWLDGDDWQIALPLAFGVNNFTIEAVNRRGEVVGTDSIRIESTVSDRPLQDFLRVSEVHYHPADADVGAGELDLDADEFEFIELVNTSETTTLDLAGAQLADGVQFTFGAVMLTPGERLVLASNPTAFASRYGGSVTPAGEYGGQLRNSGETLLLVDADGGVIQQFTYNDNAPWPEAADGDGPSLQVIRTDADYNLAASWYASPQIGGTPGAAATGAVIERMVFYNNSAFDATADDDAIAPNKSALLPGQTATSANYTNFDKGINGIMLDVAHATDALLIDDTDILVWTGNGATPTWVAATSPTISVRPDEGRGGADRVALTWPDNTIRNTWLRIDVQDDALTTGLPAIDEFYFGNAIGETFNDSSNALVTAADLIAIRDNPRGAGNRADITDRHDIDRDRHVDATDQLMARNNATGPFDALRLISP